MKKLGFLLLASLFVMPIGFAKPVDDKSHSKPKKKKAVKSVKPKVIEKKTSFTIDKIDLSKTSNESLMGVQVLKGKTYKNLSIKGGADLDNVRAETLEVFGQTSANLLKVKKLTVHGPIRITNSELKSVEIKGPVEFAGTTVSESVSVNGPVLTYSSKFKDDVSIVGSIMSFGTAFEKSLVVGGMENTFEAVGVKKLIVSKPSQPGLQVIRAKGVNIPYVEFEGNNGIIYADKKSVVSKVVGGKLERQ